LKLFLLLGGVNLSHADMSLVCWEPTPLTREAELKCNWNDDDICASGVSAIVPAFRPEETSSLFSDAGREIFR